MCKTITNIIPKRMKVFDGKKGIVFNIFGSVLIFFLFS